MIKDIIILVLCVLLLLLGRNSILSLVKKLLNKFLPDKIKKRLFVKKRHSKSKVIQNPIYPILSSEQELAIKNAIKITFTGDLILLKDMVENGYDVKSNQYEFDSMFQYVKDYYRDADYNIGIFEGPVAGENRGYSTSCFNDGIPIYLNFPKEYAQAVKRAGFDMVSLSNNHMLDQGVDGLYATLDVFDDIGLSHTGAYRNEQEKSVVTLVSVRGKKIALLPYTYGSNHYDTDFFFLQENRHLSRIIVAPNNKHIKESLESVRKDFQEARRLNPDAIVVIPHMGKQFRHAPDEFQKYWCKVFAENGADIIFSDHPHAVQPMEWMTVSDRQVLIVHCPGNFVNSYIKRDGDASMIVECYLDSETGKPIASASIPLYAYCKCGKEKKENYCGVPVYTMLRDEKIEFGKYEYDRICEVHKLVTKVALGTELQIDSIQDRYFFFPKIGYVRQMMKNNSQNMTILKDDVIDTGVLDEVRLAVRSDRGGGNCLINSILQSKLVVFVGDSITEGTKNGGYGWYEPMMASFGNKKVKRFAKGSKTSCYFEENKKAIAQLHGDLYIIAIGCNDIRYRNSKTCAMDETAFVGNISSLCKSIKVFNPNAHIVCISPWESVDFDPFCKVDLQQKRELYHRYSEELCNHCVENHYLFINPNPYIQSKMKVKGSGYYLRDHIHFNADMGIRLASEAVLASCV